MYVQLTGCVPLSNHFPTKGIFLNWTSRRQISTSLGARLAGAVLGVDRRQLHRRTFYLREKVCIVYVGLGSGNAGKRQN